MKPTNAKYIKEIIEKTNNLNYLEIKGNSLEEKQAHFQLLIREKLKEYHNDER